MKNRYKKLICGILAITLIIETIFVGGKYNLFEWVTVNAAINEDGYIKAPKGDDYEEYQTGSVRNPFVILEIVPYEGVAEIGYLVKGQEPVDMEALSLSGSVSSINFWSINVSGMANRTIFINNTDNLKYNSSLQYIGDEPQYGYFKRMGDGDGDYVQLVYEGTAESTEGGSYDYVNDEYYIYVGEGNGEYNVTYVSEAEYRLKEDDEIGTLKWVGNSYADNPENPENTNHTMALIYDEKVYTSMDMPVYQGWTYYYESNNRFAKDIMRIDEDEADDYEVRVVTVTPDELNENLHLIDYADLIYITPKDHAGTSSLWKNYKNENLFGNTAHSEVYNFDNNDLTFEAVKKIFYRSCVEEKSAIIYDITTYQNSSNKKGVQLTKYYSDGQQVENAVCYDNNCYSNNLSKLYIMMHIMDPYAFYTMYMKTGKIDEYGNYLEQTGDASVYWGVMTFYPFEIFDSYKDMGHVNNFANFGFETNLYNSSNNVNIRNNYFTFNGNTATTQAIVNGSFINRTDYTDEPFEFFENSDEEIRYSSGENNMSPADAIYYLLHRPVTYEEEINRDLTILEIEPDNKFKSDLYYTWMITLLIPNFSGNINVVQQTSKEFACSNVDLNSQYDMIYIGTLRNSNYIDGEYTNYAYIHNGVSAIYCGTKLYGGLTGSDTNMPVLKSGNDITKINYLKLADYVSGGLPLMFSKTFYSDCNNYIISPYEGADKATNVYELLLNLSGEKTFCDGNLDRDKLMEIMQASPCELELTAIPTEYKDLTVSENSALAESDIYVNGKNNAYKVLVYEFSINSSSETDTYTLNLYIDSNADGKYSADGEILDALSIYDVTTGRNADIENLYPGHQYRVTRSVEKLVGILPWKFEVVSNTNENIRDSMYGYCAIKADVKETINVLQIVPDLSSGINIVSVALPTDEEVEGKTSVDEFIGNVSVNGSTLADNLCDITGRFWYYIKDLDCFDIHFTRVSISEASEMAENASAFSNFDMIIVGFSDAYPDISSTKLLTGIKEFAEEGKAVLFSHDTTSYTYNRKINTYFRDMLGMDRYGVTLLESDRENKDKAYNYNTFQSNNSISPYIQGYTNAVIEKYNATKEQPTNMTTTVTNNNTGQITYYPYEIDEEFEVASTHAQYLQLDLESDNITVWYTLGGNHYSETPKDGRNNYYIYTTGNITYTGMGHMRLAETNSFSLSDMEIKLFVNTMIAAYRSAAAPVEILINNTDVSENGEKAFLFIDYDATDSQTAIGNGITESDGIQYKRIYFELFDKSIAANKSTSVQFYSISGSDRTKTDYVVYRSSNDRVVANDDVVAQVEYYIDVPIDTLEESVSMELQIEAVISYGKTQNSVAVSTKNVVLLRRAMFELD